MHFKLNFIMWAHIALTNMALSWLGLTCEATAVKMVWFVVWVFLLHASSHTTV